MTVAPTRVMIIQVSVSFNCASGLEEGEISIGAGERRRGMEAHLSGFTVVSDRTVEGCWILLHGVTGAVDIVTDEVVAYLRTTGEFVGSRGRPLVDERLPQPARELNLTDQEVELLKERGYLTTQSREQEIALVPRISEVLHEEAKRSPSFLVIPTLDCNYRCTYCFERPLQNALSRSRSGADESCSPAAVVGPGDVMSQAHVDAMFVAISQLRDRHGDSKDKCQLILYGGEPLDVRNETLVRHIVTRGLADGYEFAAVTNGHDLMHFLDLFGAERINQVQISLDGSREVHDRSRIHLGGESSFVKIIDGVDALLEKGGVLVQIRVHVSPEQLKDFELLLSQLGQRGWLDHPDVILYANTIYEHKDGGFTARMTQGAIDDALTRITEGHANVILNAPNVNIRAKLLPALLRGLQAPLQGNYCAGNTGQYLFTPDGHLYSCWQSLGKSDSRIGTYIDSDLRPKLTLWKEATATWFGRHVGLLDECTSCSMALVCGGGCAQFAKYANGDLYSTYCDGFEHVFRRALTQITKAYVERVQTSKRGEEATGLFRLSYS